MNRDFKGVIEKRGKWYVGRVEEIPGVNTQGRTLKEVRENLKEALELIIEANRELHTSSKPQSR
jgi:predicted RNase H-like HicB family nuclease